MTKDLASRMREYEELDGKRSGGDWNSKGLAVDTEDGKSFIMCTPIKIKNQSYANAAFVAACPAIYADAALMFGLLNQAKEALRNSNLELRTCFDNTESIIGREMIQMRMDSNARLISKLITHGLVGEGE